jgi:hypothetical protein
MKKMKRTIRATLKRAGIEATMDWTMTRMPGMEESVRRGRSTRNVRRAEKLATPGKKLTYLRGKRGGDNGEGEVREFP